MGIAYFNFSKTTHTEKRKSRLFNFDKLQSAAHQLRIIFIIEMD